MNKVNNVIKATITITLMLGFLLVSFLFLTERSIFGEAGVTDGKITEYEFNIRNIILMIAFGLFFIIGFIISSSVLNKNDKIEGVTGVFSFLYWKESAKELFDTRKMIFTTLMISVMLISRFFAIPFGTMFITWRFIPFAMVALVMGPVGTMIVGIIYSVLAWAFFISAPFLFTVPIDRAIEGLVYGILLYKTRITLKRIIILVFVSSFIVSTIINGIMMSIFLHGFNSIEQIRIFIIANRFPRDAIMFIPKIVLIYLPLKSLLPIFKYNNFIHENIPTEINLF